MKGGTMSVIELSTENFQSIVLGSKLPFLVDFWADWCGPCKMVAPIVAEIAAEQSAWLNVGKLDVDEHPALASAFRVMSIPTLILFIDGTVAEVIIGAMPKSDLMGYLSPHLAKQ
jgi:thioredoxin 1